MNNLKKKLKKKGWTKEDIHKAIKIIEHGKKKKSKKIILLDSIIHNIWTLLLLALIGNFIISIILIPFIISIQGFKIYTIIIVISVAFGSFIDILIREIRNLENKDLIIPGIILVLVTIINISLIVRFANNFQQSLGLGGFQHNPLLISVIYLVAFILPYVVKSMILCKK